MTSTPQALECPNCGAPLEGGPDRCRYCRIAIIRPGQERPEPAAPAAGPSGPLSRLERLAQTLPPDLTAAFEQGERIWPRYREEDDDLSDDDEEIGDLMMAICGVALIAAQDTRDDQLRQGLLTLSGQRWSEETADDVLCSCQDLIDEEDEEAALDDAAEVFDDLDLIEAGYEIVAGIALMNGTISVAEGEALDGIAEVFDLSRKKAKQIRRRVGETMAGSG